MSNVIPFPESAMNRRSSAAVDVHVGGAFLDQPDEHGHAVQFYETEEFLFDTVGRFLRAGLVAGDRLIVIATEAHREGFARRLDGGFARALEAGQVVLLDASDTLGQFMVGDMPDPELFREVIRRVVVRPEDTRAGVRVRAYGEMVDLLWQAGNSRAAIRLEELWNEAGKAHSFALLCAYVMGNFYKEADGAPFQELCRSHTHVMPTERFAQVADPHARLLEISMLQQRARALESEIQHRQQLEAALRDALQERSRVEDELRACLRREKEARARAEASDAFKEMFLAIFGHDLRNPLSTILTTVRLMTLRHEVAPEGEKRLERMLASGLRMQRMIEQLLDVAQARLADGIPVDRAAEHDLVPIATRIIDELRGAHPGRAIELRGEGRCRARLDPDRMEQVVSNLLSNAVAHGDPARPVTVTVAARDGLASLAVHNEGPPIDPAFLPLLFDPFKRGRAPRGRWDGLGLGLYIAERIVSAHGGKIEVESTATTGTRFEVLFPRTPHA